jgi:hypothetical protein
VRPVRRNSAGILNIFVDDFNLGFLNRFVATATHTGKESGKTCGWMADRANDHWKKSNGSAAGGPRGAAVGFKELSKIEFLDRAQIQKSAACSSDQSRFIHQLRNHDVGNCLDTGLAEVKVSFGLDIDLEDPAQHFPGIPVAESHAAETDIDDLLALGRIGIEDDQHPVVKLVTRMSAVLEFENPGDEVFHFLPVRDPVDGQREDQAVGCPRGVGTLFRSTAMLADGVPAERPLRIYITIFKIPSLICQFPKSSLAVFCGAGAGDVGEGGSLG